MKLLKNLALAAALTVAAALPIGADKTVVTLIADKITTGPGALIVSSNTDIGGSLYNFQITRLNGYATVAIEQSLNGGAWITVGSMSKLGDTLTGAACGSCAFRANVTSCAVDATNAQSAYVNSCIVTVVGTISGSPTLTVLTPTATAAATSTPTKTPTPTATNTPTATPTGTLAATLTFTPTRTPTPTFVATLAFTSTPTSTPTFTVTGTRTATPTPTFTVTGTRTATPTPTRTPTLTPTPIFIGP